MESKVCVIFNIEKSFYNKYREYEQRNEQRSMKRYYENKDKISNQRKLYYEKNRDVLLAKSKINQQNRNFERKKYKKQVEELNKKLEDLTQAIEVLKTKLYFYKYKNKYIIIHICIGVKILYVNHK